MEPEEQVQQRFLPTPSARRATPGPGQPLERSAISTHALREEGDGRRHPRAAQHQGISTHALREEGDRAPPCYPKRERYFYPRPPRGGRPSRVFSFSSVSTFLPTPSARRATRIFSTEPLFVDISTHALREEGDLLSWKRLQPEY